MTMNFFRKKIAHLSPIETLPDELLPVIFKGFDVQQLLTVACVCRKWRDASSSPEVHS